MAEFAYNNIKNININKTLFELNYKYFSKVIFENKTNFYSRSRFANKLVDELIELIEICY